MEIFSIDVGTTESAYCLIGEEYNPIEFGKVNNEVILKKIDELNKKTIIVYEEFASYGMPIGETTMQSIKWNGRIIQRCLDRGFEYPKPIYRRDEKINLCGSMKAKDSNIRQALIDRFGEVGTKNNQGWFYGFKSDIWSAYAVGITYIDTYMNIK